MRALERDNRKEADRRLKEAQEECFRNIAAREKEREVKKLITPAQPGQPKGEIAS